MRRDLLVPLEANPLEVFLLALCAFSGVTGLIAAVGGQVAPGRFAPWIDVAWYGLLTFGGLLGLAGAWWRDSLTGVLLMRSAMWPVGHGALAYAVVIGWDRQWPSAITVAVFGLACVWRYVQLGRMLR